MYGASGKGQSTALRMLNVKQSDFNPSFFCKQTKGHTWSEKKVPVKLRKQLVN